VLEEAAQRGLREIGSATLARLSASADELDNSGLTATAAAMSRFARAAGEAMRESSTAAFELAADAFLEVGLLLELASEALQ